MAKIFTKPLENSKVTMKHTPKVKAKLRLNFATFLFRLLLCCKITVM